MPISTLEGLEAVNIRKKNAFATWGSRNTENRIEPITEPAFKVPFRLKPGESIFTIGSCFARNVEAELGDRGFHIPMKELFKTPAFENLPRQIVNNFGTPSIYNEMAWAFGEEDYDQETNIVDVGNDKFVDLHMVNSVRPCSFQEVLERRQGLTNATKTLAKCRVLIMTLGLVELWWDRLSESYLNTAPLPSVMKRSPTRFALHVLSFEECFSYLRRALDIAFKNGRKDLSVILTVSPVPMMATHRNIDVVTANSYSKSVLRAVAEQLVATDNRITYFPSYETVMLSDRRFAWTDDFVHVNRDIVTLIVERMVNAFTGQPNSDRAVIPETGIESGESADAIMLAEQARVARLTGDSDFLIKHSESANTSSAFAIEYARFLLELNRHEEILLLPSEFDSVEMVTIKSRALIASGEFEAARDTIRPVCLENRKGMESWQVYIDALIALKSSQGLITAEQEWLGHQPRAKNDIYAIIGRAMYRIGHHEFAIERLEKAVAGQSMHGLPAIDCAKSFIALKQYPRAADILKGVVARTDWQAKQISALEKQIQNSLNPKKNTER